MKTITYSIRESGSNSEAYYSDVKNFTAVVLEKAEDGILPIIRGFMDYLHEFKLEDARETEEYVLEVLSFGVLWKVYASKALSVKYAPFITMSHMAEWRKKHQSFKTFIDMVRGIIITLFLLPRKYSENNSQLPTLEQIDHVCKWFEATGEFREQALRFIRWRAFWGTKSKEELSVIFNEINKFTEWFNENSCEVLGKYTSNVDGFITNKEKQYKWREDRISCLRVRLEYHLNMVGAELMNRAFLKEFSDTEAKVLLLPGCMRKNIVACKAKKVKEGLKCQGCLPECNINKLQEMGKKNNFEVYIIPHASDLSLWSPTKEKPKRGVVASACVTTLVEGGWELKRYNVPAQCVLLDFSGCKKHWHHTGFPTELNLKELKRKILNRNNN